jgi:hypothetical protein
MKHNKTIRIIQIFLIFPLLFLGQNECRAIEQGCFSDISDGLIQAFIELNSYRLKDNYFPQSVNNIIYVTKLFFIDAKTRTIATGPNVEPTNLLISEIIAQFRKVFPPLKLNAPGHLIKNTAENVNKLIELIFDPMLTPTERAMKIIKEMMEPAGVDIIVTGQFVEEQDRIQVKPLVIVKKNQKIVGKSLTFLKKNYLCSDPTNPQKKVLCPLVREEGCRAAIELLEQL